MCTSTHTEKNVRNEDYLRLALTSSSVSKDGCQVQRRVLSIGLGIDVSLVGDQKLHEILHTSTLQLTWHQYYGKQETPRDSATMHTSDDLKLTSLAFRETKRSTKFCERAHFDRIDVDDSLVERNRHMKSFSIFTPCSSRPLTSPRRSLPCWSREQEGLTVCPFRVELCRAV